MPINRRLTLILLSLIPLFSLTACGEKSSDSADTSVQIDTSTEDTSAELPIPSEIILSNTDLTLTYLGETALVTPSILDQFGSPIDSVVSWEVSNEDIISVDNNGTVTAQNNGQAYLTARLDDLQAIVEVTVSQIATEITIEPNELLFVTIGESQDIIIEIRDEGGSVMSSEVFWESTDLEVVTVDPSGRVTAQGNGTAEVTARVDTMTSSIPVQVDAINFTLDSNGITVLCPYASVGESGEINEVLYTKRDRSGLNTLIQARDWESISTTCTSGIQDMSLLFYNVYEPFSDITSWDVSSVIDAHQMFYNAGFFDQDIGHWNVSNITSMQGMFDGAFMFNHDIGAWDVSNVTNFGQMFGSAAAFNQDIGGWDVSAATNMLSMFFDASGFNQDISGWDVSNVTNMGAMFCDAWTFNQDLSGWCVSNITSEPNLFTCDYSAWTLSKPVWGTCPN